MNLRQIVLFLLFLVGCITGNRIIESPHVTYWGEFGAWNKCPFGRYAQAIQLRTEPYQGLLGDDTAANAIRLYCGDPRNITTVVINSTEGEWGNWGNVFSCRSDNNILLPPDGYIVGFQLRVEAQTIGDNTATNNIRVTCSYSNGWADQTIEADGLTYGTYSDTQRCDSNQRICAIQTQVQRYQDTVDDTALNNVAMECCDF